MMCMSVCLSSETCKLWPDFAMIFTVHVNWSMSDVTRPSQSVSLWYVVITVVMHFY